MTMDATTDVMADLPTYAGATGCRVAHNSNFVAVPDTIAIRFDHGRWTDLTKTALIGLWDRGYSTSAIGRHLGFTKNAIVGKAHRLDLPSRPSPVIRDGREPKRIRPPVPHVTLPQLASVASVQAPVVAIPKAPDARPRPSRAVRVPPLPGSVFGQSGVKAQVVPIERIAGIAPVVLPLSAKCQWPLWRDNERPTHRYCDAPATLGQSWCVDCRKRVWVRAG